MNPSLVAATAIFILVFWTLLSMTQRQKKEEFESDKVRRFINQLRHRNDQLENANLIKGQLINVLGHDISTVLHYMSEFIKELGDDRDIPQPVSYKLRRLYFEFKKADLFANDLLQWVGLQGENPDLQLQIEEIDLKEFILAKWQIFELRAEAKKITLGFSDEFNLVVKSDARFLSVVCHNILDNIVKHENSINVHITGERSNDMWELDIIKEYSNKEQTAYAAPKISEQQSRGIGMRLIKDFSAMLHIHVETIKHDYGLTSIRLKYKN